MSGPTVRAVVVSRTRRSFVMWCSFSKDDGTTGRIQEPINRQRCGCNVAAAFVAIREIGNYFQRE